MRAVKFERYGGVEVLQIMEVDRPVPAPGQTLIRMKAAGINPIEAKIRQGLLAARWPATFPCGEGNDLAGVVEEPGPGVTGFARGAEVIGFTLERASHAEFVVAPENQLVLRPPSVSWEQGGALYTSGTTAYAAVRAVALQKGETVAVSAAAGGVGSLAVQLAARTGARVIGLASEANHAWLRQHGVIPIAHGDGMEERLREAAGGRLDAFIDAFGHGYVDLALKLGVPAERIDTIAYSEAGRPGVKKDGNKAGATAEVLGELARLVVTGALELTIAKVYPLAQVRDAFQDLEQSHTRGKIVLVP